MCTFAKLVFAEMRYHIKVTDVAKQNILFYQFIRIQVIIVVLIYLITTVKTGHKNI
jgi:hypothetical protein